MEDQISDVDHGAVVVDESEPEAPPAQEVLPFIDPNPMILALKQQRDHLTKQISEIENMLGFVETSADLAVRVAKIEKFVGIKA